MANTKGIGGIFLRAQDPDRLSAWYSERLGIGAGLTGGEGLEPLPWAWHAGAGPVVFAAFPADTDYFPADRPVMLNFRVGDLDEALRPFRDAGEQIVTDPQWDSPQTGRFARVFDPEGNPIELWEPPAA
jgi:predicted enzyme related to lactoylglutathione lyase